MKKSIIIVSLACLGFLSCSEAENKKVETPAQPAQPSVNADTTKPTVDKKTQDSIDAAHGHTH
jgi:hypothetical protein